MMKTTDVYHYRLIFRDFKIKVNDYSRTVVDRIVLGMISVAVKNKPEPFFRSYY
jgi:hypothetical protein